MVLWLPSLWSSQIHNLSLQGWWAGFLLSGRVQLPQRHPAENVNRKRTWCKNQAWSLKEMWGGQGLNLETVSDNRCLKSSGRSKNSSNVCILLPCKDYTESLSDKNSSGLHSFTLTVCSDGMCKVFGPALPMNRFWSLMLANVPLVITASFPLRAPYELNSRGVRLEEIMVGGH